MVDTMTEVTWQQTIHNDRNINSNPVPWFSDINQIKSPLHLAKSAKHMMNICSNDCQLVYAARYDTMRT